MGCAEAAGISRASKRPVGTADDFKRHCIARRGAIHCCGAPLDYRPTLTWAAAKATSVWRQRAGAMGGGTGASLRGHRIGVMTDSWERAAMRRSEPRRHNGPGAVATSQTGALMLQASPEAPTVSPKRCPVIF